MARQLLTLLLIAAPLSAEFLHVEQSVTGLDCMSCAESAPRNLKKIKGVESASFRTSDSVAVLELKNGNRLTLGDIRDAMKHMGYTPTGAKVAVKGQPHSQGDKWTLRVAGIEAEYPLTLTAGQAKSGALHGDSAVIVEGSIAQPDAPILVTAIRLAE